MILYIKQLLCNNDVCMYVCMCVCMYIMYVCILFFILYMVYCLLHNFTIVVLQAYFLVNIVITFIVAIGYPQHLALRKIWT